MSLIQSYAFHFILILVALLVVSVAINCILYPKKSKGKGRRKSSSSDSVPKSKYEDIVAERNEYRKLYNQATMFSISKWFDCRLDIVLFY